MYSSIRKPLSALRAGIAVLGICTLAACEGGIGGATAPATPAAPQTPAPDFATATDHFASLQRAGLGARYSEFASHLKAADPKVVTDALQRSFRGGPFDVYTRKSAETGGSFQRLVELRSTSGRLYLFVEMTKVPGGWIVSGHDIDRKRSVIMARL